MTTQADFLKQAIEKGYENAPSLMRSIPSATGEYGRPGTNYAYSFKTDYGNMMFYPDSFVNKGIDVDGKTYYNSWFQDEKNLNNFALNSTYVDLSGIKDNGRGYATKGYLIPFSAPQSSFPNPETLYNQPTSEIGSITGLSKTADGKLVYAVERSQGAPGGYIQPAAPSIKQVGVEYVNTGFGTTTVPTFANVGPVTSEIYNPAARGQSNNFVDKLITNIGPIVKLAAIVTENPGLYAAAASYDIANGNYLGAALSVAGMYGNAPGVDANTAATAKNIYNGLQLANAIKTNNPIGALTALSGMSGTGLPSEFMKATQLIAVNSAIQKKDWSALAVAVGNIADNKDLSYAGKAANVVNALKTGDIAKITKSLYGFIPELREGYKTGDISAIFDKMGYPLGDNEKQLLESGKSESPEQLTKTITGFAPDELSPDPLTAKQASDMYEQAAKDAGFPDLQTQIAYGGNIQAYNEAAAIKRAEDYVASTTPKSDATFQPATPVTPVADTNQQPAQHEATQDEIQAYWDKVNAQGYYTNIGDRRFYYDPKTDSWTQVDANGNPVTASTEPTQTNEPSPVTPEPVQPGPVEQATDDGTTGGIQDVIDQTAGGGTQTDTGTQTGGGSLGDESDLPPVKTEEEPQCAEGYHWNGSMCVADSDTGDTSTTCPDGYVFDLTTHSCVPVGTTAGGTKTGGGTAPKTPTTPTTPTTPATPTTTPKTPTTPAAPATPALSSNNLMALLALDNQTAQQQQVQPAPLADIKYYYDFNNDIGSNIFAGDMVPQMPQNTQGPATFGFSDGGEVEDDFSVDDLIGMLKGD